MCVCIYAHVHTHMHMCACHGKHVEVTGQSQGSWFNSSTIWQLGIKLMLSQSVPLLPTELFRHRKVSEVTGLCAPNSDADILAPQVMVPGGGPLWVPVVRSPGWVSDQ